MAHYGRWLWLLAALFALRVVAQPLALVVSSRFLPRFESWHSGLIPYSGLVAVQIVILAWLFATAARVSRAVVRPRRAFGTCLLTLAGVYGATMVVRLLLGATVLRGERWFASPVPTTFHLVLASYLFVYGHFHYRHG